MPKDRIGAKFKEETRFAREGYWEIEEVQTALCKGSHKQDDEREPKAIQKMKCPRHCLQTATVTLLVGTLLAMVFALVFGRTTADAFVTPAMDAIGTSGTLRTDTTT